MNELRALPKLLTLIRSTPIVGRFLRWWIRRYPEGSIVTIKAGAGKGMRWQRFRRYEPAFWLGTYEPAVQQFLTTALCPGDVFYDIGANAGFLTVLAARLVGPSGRVVAFEPAALNIESLTSQVTLNGLHNVVVVEKAVGGGNGPASFDGGDNLSQGRLGPPTAGQPVTVVEAVTLDTAIERYGPPTLIKVDIEGGGVELVRGARQVVSQYRPVWLLEIHNPAEERAFRDLLAPLGYLFEDLEASGPIPSESPLPGQVVARPPQRL